MVKYGKVRLRILSLKSVNLIVFHMEPPSAIQYGVLLEGSNPCHNETFASGIIVAVPLRIQRLL